MNTLVIGDAELAATGAPAPDTYPTPRHGWTCYHCGETFTTPGAAAFHFGAKPDATPGCLLKVKVGDERGWLIEIRKLEAERDELLRERCAEDSELHRALQAKEADMQVAVRRAEEQGYARGLADAKKYPETLGLQLTGAQP